MMLRFSASILVLFFACTAAQAAAGAYEWLGNTVPKNVAAKLASCPTLKELTVGEAKAVPPEGDTESGVFRIRYSANKALYGVSCDMGASNVWWAAVLVEGKIVKRLKFPMVNESGKLVAEDVAGGLNWEAKTGLLNSGVSAGCAGSNSVTASFRLTGKKLKLLRQEATNAGEDCDKPVTTIVYPP